MIFSIPISMCNDCGSIILNIYSLKVICQSINCYGFSPYTRCITPASGSPIKPQICYDELREDVMIWVLETCIFESDQNEFQSVVPTLYVVKVCGNCILNAKNSKKQFKRPISLFSLCAVESSLLKRPIFDGNSRNENAFFSMFSNSMT